MSVTPSMTRYFLAPWSLPCPECSFTVGTDCHGHPMSDSRQPVFGVVWGKPPHAQEQPVCGYCDQRLRPGRVRHGVKGCAGHHTPAWFKAHGYTEFGVPLTPREATAVLRPVRLPARPAPPRRRRPSEAGTVALACAAFGAIPLLGALDPFAGLALLAVFGVVAILRALLKNAWMLVLMLVLVGVSMAYPVLAPLPILIGIWFFIKRISFFFEHFKLVGLGVALYAAGALLAFNGPLITATAAAALSPSTAWAPLLAPAATFLSGALTMALVLALARAGGYTARTSLEIMSLVPVILVSLALPLLKITFDFVPDIAPDVVPDAVPVTHAPMDHVAAAAPAADQGLVPVHDLAPAAHGSVADSAAVLRAAGTDAPAATAALQHQALSTGAPSMHAPLAPPAPGLQVAGASAAHAPPALPTLPHPEILHAHDPVTLKPQFSVLHQGSRDLVMSPHGTIEATLQQSGDRISSIDMSGHTELSAGHLGGQHVFMDANGIQRAFVERQGAVDVLREFGTQRPLFHLKHFGGEITVNDAVTGELVTKVPESMSMAAIVRSLKIV